MSIGTHWQKQYVAFVKQFPTLGKEMSDLRRKVCSLVIKSALLSPDGQLEEYFWKNFYFLWFFSDVQGTFLVFSLYQSRHGGPNWIPPAKRNISIKKKFRENFLSFPEHGRNFLNFRWSLLGMLSKLQFTCSQEHFEKGYFFRNFQTFFRTLIDNRPDLWRKCSAALPKLHSTCRKIFSIFLQNFCHVSFNFVFERKKVLVLKKSFVSFVKVSF